MVVKKCCYLILTTCRRRIYQGAVVTTCLVPGVITSAGTHFPFCAIKHYSVTTVLSFGVVARTAAISP